MDRTESRNHVMAEGFRGIVTSLQHESDRGTVVLASAWLDEALTRIISKFFKPVSNNGEKLLKAGQPLGDFGTKIMLADRLGLVNKHTVESLNICRRLRNDFAHLSTDLSFSTPEVKDRVEYLFKLNEDLLSVMGRVLEDAGMPIGAGDSTQVTGEHMLKKFGHKLVFQYTCGFINSGLAAYEHDVKASDPQFEGE